MGTKRQSRQTKKAEKRKKTRSQARSTRGSRAAPGGTGRVNVETALRWSVGECFLSEDWHEQGARVAAIFTRRSGTGRVAASIFDVDLAERGVVAAALRGGLSDVDVQGELARLSGQGTAMVSCEAALLVKLVTEAHAHAVEGGHAQAPGYAKAIRLFGDVDPSGASEAILVGAEPPPPEEKGGLVGRLKSMLGRG